MLLHAAVDELVDLVDQPVEEIAVVRDHDDRAVVGLQGLLQNIFRPDVHMVGRLVERQQIVRLEHQLGHRQPGTLAAAEHGHALVDVFALEQERGQDVAQLRADVAHRDAVERIEDRGLLVEDIFLILRIIADVHIVPHLRLAVERLELAHQHAHHRGLAFAVAAHEGHFFAAADHEIRAFEHRLLRIADHGVLHFKHHVAAARGGRELDVDGRKVFVVDLDALDALELLHARLHLVALGGLVAETLDEFLGLFDHPLLVQIRGFLLRDAFLAQLHILGVRHLVIVQMPQHHLHRAGGAIVEETAVVRDQHERAGKTLFQIVFQPLDRLDVEVVRGLVEQQHLGPAEQDLRQFDAHVPALGEGFGLAAEFVFLEAQTGQGALHGFFRGFAPGEDQLVVHFVELDDEPLISG